MAGLAWLDGRVSPIGEAQVAVEDRGYLFGDGVYEVLRAYRGRPFAVDDHMDRLAWSAAGIELALPFEPARFEAIAMDLLARTGLAEAEIYIEVTRGAARRNHLFPADVPPSVLVWVQPLRAQDPALRERGLSAVVLPDERWARCNLKTVGLLPNVLAKQQAHRRGAQEALLVRDGMVTEGTTCNVFAVRAGALVTPTADHRILPGVTRGRLLGLAGDLGVALAVRDLPEAELRAADEVFVTGTTIEVMPVTTLDGRPVGDGRPGPVTRRLMDVLRAHIEATTLPPGG